MAYGFGSGVQAELGTTDYSNYLRGALSGAQMQAQGGAAIGAGVQNALAGIGKGIQKYQENKILSSEIMGGVEANIDFLANNNPEAITNAPEEVAKILKGIDKGNGIGIKDASYLATWSGNALKNTLYNEEKEQRNKEFAAKQQDTTFRQDVANQTLQQLINSNTFEERKFDAEEERRKSDRDKEDRGDAAFQAGYSAMPNTILEEVEMRVAEAPEFAKQSIDSFNGVLPFIPTPGQSVDDLMQGGKISPLLSTPEQSVDSLMLGGGVTPEVPVAAAELKTIQAVPDNIKPYFAFNPQTGKLVSTRKLQLDTEGTTARYRELEQEKATINSGLKTEKEETVTGMAEAFQPTYGYQPLQGDTVNVYTQRLDEIEKEQAPLKEKLIELENARQSAADFEKQPDKKPSVEKTASKVIERSIRFAKEVNLDPVDKNQWMQMKTVLRKIPREATGEEKVAAFVKAYSKIAPIDASVYFKMKQAFGTAPVITDLGNGNQIVTVNGQSFFNKKENEGTVPASTREYEGQEKYAQSLALFASKMPLDQFRERHPDLYVYLLGANITFAPKSGLTGAPIPLSDMWDMIRGGSGGQGSATPPSGARSEADFIINQR